METVETEELDNYCVYLITNLANNKKYAGMTFRPEARWREHKRESRLGTGRHLYWAMRCYGEENFSFEIIKTGLSHSEANEEEASLISRLGLKNPEKGYNLTDGGDGTKRPREESTFKRCTSRGWKRDPLCQEDSYFAFDLPTEKICKEYQSGISLSALAKKYECSDESIGKRLRSAGIELRRGSSIMTEQVIDQMKKSSSRKRWDISDEVVTELYLKGETVFQIAEKVGMSFGGVWIRLRALGIKCRGTKRDLPDDEIFSLYREGKSAEQIGKQFGIDGDGIIRRLRKAGMSIRPASSHKKPFPAEAQEMYYSGASFAEIGRKFNMSHINAKRRLRQMGTIFREGISYGSFA